MKNVTNKPNKGDSIEFNIWLGATGITVLFALIAVVLMITGGS